MADGPIIAPQHAREAWRPLHPWPNGAYVQWGGRGVVFGGNDAYNTAFFEAFPKDGTAGFLRGEGKTIPEAESAAFAQWQRYRACLDAGGHRWTRTRRLRDGKTSTYTNGGCFCLRCGAFQTVMAAIVNLGSYKQPLDQGALGMIARGACREDTSDDPKHAKWRRGLWLRAKLAGINLPPITERPTDIKPFDEDAYQKACRLAVKTYCRANPPPASIDGGVLDGLLRASLRSIIEAEDDE